MNNIKNNIIDITENNYKHLLSLENVNGIGLGYKWINGVCTNEICLHVLVENKKDIKYITKNNRVPYSYMGIKTDIIEIGKVEPLVDVAIKEKFRPLKGGIGISLVDSNELGTLGCIVSKKVGDKKHFFILSNNHGIANLNKAPIGSPIIQPVEKFGGNVVKDVIANLTTFIPLEPIKDESLPEDTYPINYVDCAIAKINKRSLISTSIHSIGKIKGVAKANLDEEVTKVGCVTGLTTGTIVTLSATTITDMAKDFPVLFQNQIVAEIYETHGDSGSIILNNENKAIGLLYAGTSKGTAFINDIDLVLDSLNVDIYVE